MLRRSNTMALCGTLLLSGGGTTNAPMRRRERGRLCMRLATVTQIAGLATSMATGPLRWCTWHQNSTSRLLMRVTRNLQARASTLRLAALRRGAASSTGSAGNREMWLSGAARGGGSFYFHDGHPSTAVHRIVAREMEREIEKAFP